MRTDLSKKRPEARPRGVHLGLDIIIAAIWVAISAAAPEFIWRGAFVIVAHAQWGDLVAAVLIGLILAFFIEPAVERLRHARHDNGDGPAGGDRSYHLLFPTLAGLAFAFSSVAIHDAIRAFVSNPESGKAGHHFGFDVGLLAAIHIVDAWTFVPFCTSLAWLTARRRRIAEPLAVLAILSPAIAAWWFSWPVHVLIATWLPALAIIATGYRQWPRGPVRLFHQRCAVSVAWIAVLWLAAAVLIDWIMSAVNAHWVPLYDWQEFGADARFYLGWIIGLLLAPVPLIETVKRTGQLEGTPGGPAA
ncbi:MAG TPA: hypothetical protein VHX12_01985 [Acidisoma sp.]|nr:hypothetical protein [Acidisoma sp.]